MSDVHVQPDGTQVWIVHSAIEDLRASPSVLTAHFGVYVPATNKFFDVLDTTGTLGKKILFPSNDRVLYVTGRGDNQDVFVTIDTVARRPLNQRSYPGDRSDFRLSPGGRALLATDRASRLHLIDTTSLVDQLILGILSHNTVAWAASEDVLYSLHRVADATELRRLDLRTADLSSRVPPPTVVATIAGAGDWLTVSPSNRYAAFVVNLFSAASQIAIIDLVTATVTTIAGDFKPEFTNDNRAIVWQPRPDDTVDLVFVDPATGIATPPLSTKVVVPWTTPLRRRDMMIAEAIVGPGASFLYTIADGTQTPISQVLLRNSQFERPARPELWMWSEYDDTLSRLDLATGKVVDLVVGADSVDYRGATDDIVVGTFDPAIRMFSMATARFTDQSFVLPDPSDTPAPFRLSDD